MKPLVFSYRSTARVDDDTLAAAAAELEPEIVRVTESIAKKYETEYASCALPGDAELLEKVQTVVEAKQRLNPSALVVIGIGGSHLGAAAVLQALYGRYYNEQQPICACYFVDTVDSDTSYDVYLLVEQLLQEEKNVVLNMISKSGSTLETAVNAALFLNLLKKYHPRDYQNFVVVTTDHGSPLWQSAQREEFACLEIPAKVGGRFSVLSAVGLFPLGLLGVDLEQLRAGAATMLAACMQTDVEKNPAALSATLLKEHYYRTAIIHDTFIFSGDLMGLGYWYRQLMGESIGKKFDRSGGLVCVGMLPTVSQGSSDLHSVGQLYLAGPKNRFTTFVTVERNRSDLVMPHEESMTKGVIKDGTFAQCMSAIAHGTMIAYQKEDLPFVHLTLPEKSAWHVGQFLQMKMIEILYLGYLLDINPFDQPEVELYKRETRKLLNHE